MYIRFIDGTAIRFRARQFDINLARVSQEGKPKPKRFFTGGMLPVEGVLGPAPAEYGVETGGGAFGTVSAAFRKTQPGPGMLKVKLLSAGEVMAEGESSDEWGSVEVRWNPQA